MVQTLADKNQQFWNQASHSVFKDKWVHDPQKQISKFLTSHIDWIGVQHAPNDEAQYTKMMDYACGNGIVSRVGSHLRDMRRSPGMLIKLAICIGIDLANTMLDKYRATAADFDLEKSRMIAVQGDLLAPVVQPTTPVLNEEELGVFDLVAICMALHHVDDVELATKRLAERLRPGGVLLIIDWATRNSSEGAEQQHHPMLSSPSGKHQHRHDHHGHGNTHGEVSPTHPAAHTISHDSFTRTNCGPIPPSWLRRVPVEAGRSAFGCPWGQDWQDAAVLGTCNEVVAGYLLARGISSS